MRELFYFTTYYPNRDVQWKTDELKILSEHFDIRLIPFENQVFEHKAKKQESVKYENALFETFKNPSIQKQLLTVITSSLLFKLLPEFFGKKVFLSKTRLILWTESAYKILTLKKNKYLKKIFNEADKDSILYFYWGRETSEAIGFLPKTKANIIVRFHGYDLYEYRHKGNYIPFRTSQLKRLDHAVFVSENGKEYLKNRYKKISFSSHVFRLGTYSFGKALQSEDNILRIVSCSSVIPLKRVDIIAKAVMMLDINVEWTHIGAGSGFEQLKKEVENSPKNIKVNLPGQVPSKNIPSFFVNRNVDLFINASTTEGLPVSVMEAMAAGVPVLATDVGGTKELVSSKTGKLINSDIDAISLSEEIRSFALKTIAEKNTLRENAFYTFKEKVNFEKNCLDFLYFLKEKI